MRVLFLALWIAVLVSTQVAAAELIRVGWAAPDFLALLAIFVAMYVPRGEAVAVGALIGLAGDMLASARLGPMAASLACACAVLVTVRPRRARARGPRGALVAGLAVFGANAVYGAFRAFGWGGPGVERPLVLALKIGAYTGAAAWLIFPIMVMTAGLLGYPDRCRALHRTPALSIRQTGPSGYPLNPKD